MTITPKILVVNNGSKFVKNVGSSLASAGADVTMVYPYWGLEHPRVEVWKRFVEKAQRRKKIKMVQPYGPIKEFLDQGFHGVVGSGGGMPIKKSVDDRREPLEEAIDWYRNFFEQLGVPYLGICYGCGALAMAYGNWSYTSEEKSGFSKVKFVGKKFPLLGNVRTLELYSHYTMLVEAREGGVLTIHKDSVGEQQALSHPEKPQYGVYCHPEMGKGGSIILDNFLELC